MMGADDQLASTLDQFFSTSPDLVFIQDRRGRFTYVNPAGSSVLGFEQLYFLGKTWSDLRLSGSLKERLAAEFEHTFTTGQRSCGEFKISIAYETRDYEYVLSPVQRANGEVEQIILTARDITEQKRAETALRESEEKYRSLFEAASDLILIVDASNYRILDANWSAARQLGYARGELLQRSIYEIEVPLSASRRATVLQHLDTEGSFTYENIYRCKDGTKIPVEISTQVIEYGNLLAFQSFARDITERKQAEAEIHALNAHLEQRVLERTAELSCAYKELADEVAERRKVEVALREQQLFLRHIIDTCPNPIFVKDKNGRFVLVNQAVAEVYETTVEDLTGKTDADFNPNSAEVKWFEQTDRETLTSLQPKFVLEESVTSPSGKTRWYQTIKKPLQSFEGQANQVLGVAADITQRKQMEAALQASEARYRAIVEDQTELVCRFLPDGTLTFVNEAYCQMLGIPREELLGHGYKMFLLVLDQQAATHLMAPANVDHAVSQAECRVILPNGSVRWQQWNNRAIFDSQDNLVEFQAVGLDITERKRIEASLRESEACFRAIFEQAAVGITQTDAAGRYLRVNQRFCEILGYTEAELLQRTFQSITHPSDLPVDLAYARQMLAGQISSFSLEKRYICKDGRPQWVNLASSLVRDAAGVPEYFISIIEDISVRNQAKEHLRRIEEHSHTLADASTIMVWIADADGQATFFNQSWLNFTGRAVEQEIGYGWTENVHLDDLQECLDAYISAFTARRNFKVSYRLRQSTGEYRWILHVGKPKFSADGNFIGYRNLYIDITVYRKYEKMYENWNPKEDFMELNK